MSILVVEFEKSHIYTILCNVCFSQEHIYQKLYMESKGCECNKLCHHESLAICKHFILVSL